MDTDRDDKKMLQFTLLAILAANYTSTSFWSAFDNDEQRVYRIQKEIRDEMKVLAKELFP